MSIKGLMLRRVIELAECGKQPDEIAASIKMSERAVRNTMAMYHIKVHKPYLGPPRPDIRKLMGGRP
jgi:hypothetical protein